MKNIMKKIILWVVVALNALILVGCSGSRPEVSQAMIDFAVGVVTGYENVIDAAIVANGGNLSLAIIVPHATSVDYAQQLGDNFVRGLGFAASIHNKDLTGPSKDSYGSLYKSYDVTVSIATPAETIIASAAKVKSSPALTWR